MVRKSINTTLDEKLYKKIQFLALELNKNANDLIEEGMEYVIQKYSKNNSREN